MQVYLLTKNQKNELVGVKFIPDNYYNPIQDYYSNWIISIEEYEQTTNENYLWVKDLPQIEYKPIDHNGK
jgi:hypothetical protein